MSGLKPLVVFWSGWGIHFMVLLSFAVQVLLLVLADIRRYKDWPVLKVFIWLAYMMADTTAIYALGHMSVVCRAPEHQLMALWAPLLLVHLGGQDNITAYAIEDNRLWLRHLQNFGLQVIGAAYVLYVSSILSSPRVVFSATILMSVVGVLKYGERVWALMHADSCASSSLSATTYDLKDLQIDEHAANSREDGLDHQDGAARALADALDERSDIEVTAREYQYCLRVAYSLLDVPKQMFEGPTKHVKVNIANRTYEARFVLGMVWMQLSMMHDLLYTKAAVVHTWYGLCSRVISLAFTVTALLLLLALSDKDGYSRVDVAVTRFLMIGAVVLETVSVLRAVFSKWTAVLLFEKKWNRFGSLALKLEYLYTRKILMTRGEDYLLSWSGPIRQHNFFVVQRHTNYTISSRIAKMMGLEDWWDSMFYSWTSRVPPGIIKMVVYLASTAYYDEDIMHYSQGRNALRRWHMEEEATWMEDLELDESILVWHIATSVYIEWLIRNNDLNHNMEEIVFFLRENMEEIDVLSNYMFFLLASRPYMLPYPVSRRRYVKLCCDTITHMGRCTAGALLRDILLHQGEDTRSTALRSINSTLDMGCKLAEGLINKSKRCYDVQQMILQVWGEMLFYTAYRCNENFHAKLLSDGGEFMTVVTLLMIYMTRGLINKNRRDARDQPAADTSSAEIQIV